MRLFTTAALASVLALAAGCSDDPRDDRADLMREVEASVASLDERIEALGARLRDDDLEAEYHDLLANLEEERVKLGDRLEDAMEASEDAWDELVADVRATCQDLEQEADALLEKISDES
ncbi:MAG: hypothetical protein ACF8XB_19240 [Planctomycetota bacterium JB042]